MSFDDLKAKLKRETRRIGRQLNPSAATSSEPVEPLDLTTEEKALIKQVQPYTMTSMERIASLSRAVDYVIANRIEGDFVECGVAAGGSSMAMMLRLTALGATDRRVWMYDTYEGMPEPTEEDRGRYGETAIARYRQRLKDGVSTWINHPIEAVKAAVATTGYPAGLVTYVQGKVEETLPLRKPEKLAILRMDTDWHASTAAEMDNLWPRLSVGGIAIADDYYRWRGSRKAIDDYTAAHGLRLFWARIDDHAAVAVKQHD